MSAAFEGFSLRLDHYLQRKGVLAGKFEIPLVMGRYRHDRAGAVIGKDEVCEIDRHALAGDRIEAVGAGEDPFLFKSSAVRAAFSVLFTRSMNSSTLARFSGRVSSSAIGCSGASDMKVAP